MVKIGTLVFILGMHRSGTSAVANLLSKLGVDLGGNLLPGDPMVNKHGFWENIELIDIHNELMATFDSSWFDFRGLPTDWLSSKKTEQYRSRIVKALEKDFTNHDLMAVKDPRLCRLLPLWLDIVRQAGGLSRFLLVMRNPLEVAGSLKKRDNFDIGTSALLWLVYTLESEFYSRDAPRTIVRFDRILDDWRESVSRISIDLRIEWPVKEKEIEDIIAKEIDSGLRHHNIKINGDDKVNRLARTALDVYERMTSEPINELEEYLDHIRVGLYTFEPIAGLLADTLYRTNETLYETTFRFKKLTGERGRHVRFPRIQRYWTSIKSGFN